MVTVNAANNKTGATGKVLQGQGVGTASDFSTATYPSTATGTGTLLRADGTNWSATTTTYPNTNAVSTLLYASGSNVMSALATANSGVLSTSATGVPSIDTTNFAVLTTGVQLKGNNTNTAPPAGFIGEYITSFASGIALSTATAANITSISLTAGVWNISAIGLHTYTGLNTQSYLGISATSATFAGNNGDQYIGFSTPSLLNPFIGLVVPDFRVLLSSTTTYYLVGQGVFSSGTDTGQGRISATRVG